MSVPSVKGLLLLPPASLIDAALGTGDVSQDEVDVALEAADLALLEAKLDPARWYPVASLQRMSELAARIAGGERAEALRGMGASAAGAVEDTGVRKRHERGGLFAHPELVRSALALDDRVLDFGHSRVEAEPEADVIRIHYEGMEGCPEAVRLVCEGFAAKRAALVLGREWDVRSENVRPGGFSFRLVSGAPARASRPGGLVERRAVGLPEYGRVFSGPPGPFQYLDPVVASFLPPTAGTLRILDIGCGNGYWAGRMLELGHEVVGVDASAKRIAQARSSHPGARFEQAEVNDALIERLGEPPFDLVVSTEVVEHLLLPSKWAALCFEALVPGGRLICSTPYHGYVKNVFISLSDRWDRHHHTLRNLGHIKFFSVATLTKLLTSAGFEDVRLRGAGGYPYLWKSVVATGARPR